MTFNAVPREMAIWKDPQFEVEMQRSPKWLKRHISGNLFLQKGHELLFENV
jgi:hypothetical protein